MYTYSIFHLTGPKVVVIARRVHYVFNTRGPLFCKYPNYLHIRKYVYICACIPYFVSYVT